MTERPSQGKTVTAMKAYMVKGPPWPLRFVGIVLLLADAAVFMFQIIVGNHLESWLELGGHILWGLIALTLAYPEGAKMMMDFLRRLPLFDRRRTRREDS